MGHCYHHALSSVRKWGGVAEDYLPLHQWFDESKAITADFRHRALRHHAEGIFMLERFFGATITISTGRDRAGAADRRTACRRGSRLHPELRRLGALHPARALDGPRAADPQAGRSVRSRQLDYGRPEMYGTYLRLDITVHDGWRTVIRAAARKLKSQARRDPALSVERHRFYRQMLAHHDQAQEIVRTWRL